MHEGGGLAGPLPFLMLHMLFTFGLGEGNARSS